MKSSAFDRLARPNRVFFFFRSFAKYFSGRVPPSVLSVRRTRLGPRGRPADHRNDRNSARVVHGNFKSTCYSLRAVGRHSISVLVTRTTGLFGPVNVIGRFGTRLIDVFPTLSVAVDLARRFVRKPCLKTNAFCSTSNAAGSAQIGTKSTRPVSSPKPGTTCLHFGRDTIDP